MTENEIGKIILDCSIKVHKALGPGLLEKCYEACLAHELKNMGLRIDRQKEIPIRYDDLIIDEGYRIDLLVENKVVIELKAVEKLNDIHKAQIITYLKLGEYKLGYLINFNEVKLIDGLVRIVNNL